MSPTARPFPALLGLTRVAIKILNIFNLALGAAILALLVATLVAWEPVTTALGFRDVAGNVPLMVGGRLIMVLGIAWVGLGFVILTRLGAIVDTVKLGDPFVVVNAGRLRTIAWAVLGIEVLRLVIGGIAAAISTEANRLDPQWDFSAAGLLAVLLLFVLAGVFEHGARMREDLEGTI